jgi:hypothetical protein
MDLICLKELERVADPRERDPGPGRREDRKYRWAHIYIPSTSIDHAANLVVPARHLKVRHREPLRRGACAGMCSGVKRTHLMSPRSFSI